MPDIYVGTLELDTEGPVFGSFFPLSEAQGVSAGTNLSFQVTDAGAGVDLDTLSVTVNGSLAVSLGEFVTGFTGSISPITNGYSVTVNPSADLPYGLVTTVDYYSEDLAVVPNSTSGSWSFTTAPDTTPPVVSSRSPAAGATGVLSSTSISFNVTDPETGVALGTINVDVDGVPAVVGGLVQSGFTGSVSAISSGYAVSITPDEPLTSVDPILVELTAYNLASPSLQLDTSWSFTTQEEAAITYLMRAFCTATSEYAFWGSPTPDPTGASAPCSPVEDVVVFDIVPGGSKTYLMRAYRASSSSYVVWSSVGSPDPAAAQAPFPAGELSDVVVAQVLTAA